MTDQKQIFVIINPAAGNRSGDEVRGALAAQFDPAHINIYETTGEEDMAEVVGRGVDEGASCVFAAGGDGTVTEVMNGLVGRDVPLGIIPCGTANCLARDLNLPLNVAEACAFLADHNTVRHVDVLEFKDDFLAVHVSIGLIAAVIENTSREAKNANGLGAYVATLGRQLMNHEPERFALTVDGERHELNAAEIMIANVAASGIANILWGKHIVPDDGQLDVCVINTEGWQEHAQVLATALVSDLVKSQFVRYFTAKESIKVESLGDPKNIDGDGEIISQTPFEGIVRPGAVSIFAPPV